MASALFLKQPGGGALVDLGSFKDTWSVTYGGYGIEFAGGGPPGSCWVEGRRD